MADRRVVIVGASGLVGRACVDVFRRQGDVVGTYHHRAQSGLVAFDLTAPDEASRLMETTRPRVVVCAGADPHVEGCEANPDATRRVNVEGTLRLAEAARRVGARFVFFSSEYVFDGTAGLYVEDDERRPLNEYGRQKMETEVGLASIDGSLVIRTSGVFGWSDDGKNFVLQLRAILGRGERMRVPEDQEITPAYAPNLAAVVGELVEQGVGGVVHVAASRPMNRVSFARAAARTFGLDPALIDPTPTSALGLKAVRPLRAGLSTAKAAALARTRLLDADEGLRAMRDARPSTA